MKQALGCLFVLCIAQSIVVKADPEVTVRNVVFRLFNESGINATVDLSHLLSLVDQNDALTLAEKYGSYDDVSKIIAKVTKLFLDLNKAKNIYGPKLALAVSALKELRNRLGVNASDQELIFADAEIDVFGSLVDCPQRALLIEKELAVSNLGGLGLNEKDIKNLLINGILEAYQFGGERKINPRAEVKAVLLARQRLDSAHPLSTPLRHLINALKALYKKVHPGKGSDKIGDFALKKEIHLLQLAKSRQDDSILDGLKGNALTLYEQIVQNLKDLKRELRK